MNKYKMICLDIDGTLLNSEHNISPNTKEVIKVVSKVLKIPVILVSARMPKGILFLQEELNISYPMICYSGALIMENKANILSNINIPISEVKQVYKFARDMGIHVSLYKDDQWYIEEMDAWAIQESEITNISPIIISFEDLFELWEMENFGPNKILCMAEPNKIDALNTKIKNYDSSNLNIYPSKPTYLEIMPIDASKTTAIELLCKKFEIQKSEVIAIGDNYNDISMIEFAGLGIAMGNAPDAVKQYADVVTLSNDEDGVAEAIKKYISVCEHYSEKLLLPGVWEITDKSDGINPYVNMYLIEGSTGALLIDAGDSKDDLNGYIRKLTRKPIDLIITHGHDDHTAGMSQFEKVYMSHKDIGILNTDLGFSADKSRVLDLREGEVFDLGDCKIEVITLPGHTNGSVVLLDRERQLLFSSDSLGSSSIWMQLPHSTSVEAYVQQLYKLEKIVEGMKDLRLLVGHVYQQTTALSKPYITDIRILAEKIVAGEVVGTPTEDQRDFTGGLSASYGQMLGFIYKANNIFINKRN